MIGRAEVDATAQATAAHVADWLIGRVAAAAGPVRIALSGGSTPKLLFSILRQPERAARMQWNKLHIFWGDERCVPLSSEDSNAGEAMRLLLDHVPVPQAQVHAWDVAMPPDLAAARYEALLRRDYGADTLDPARPLFDVNLLGVGEDGHTASLIPGQPVLRERQAWTAAVGQGRPEVRLTLTYPALESARVVAFIATGAKKADILRRLRDGTADVPVAHLRPAAEAIWFVDRAAWGEADAPGA